MAVALSMWGPEQSIPSIINLAFWVPIPLALSIGSKLGIYAAVAEILSRPDGGSQGLPRSLHSPRWRFLVGYLENISPSLSWKHYSPWGQGVQSLPSGSYGRDYHPC